MVYQWYLFVLLIGVAIFASSAGQTYTIEVHGRKEKRYGWVPVLMIAIPMIILAGTRPNIGDTSAYRIMFRNTTASLSGIVEALIGNGKDKGFNVFTILVKSVIGNNDILFFTIIATITLSCVVCVFRKYSCNFIMSMFLFIASSDYIQWNYNGMRQFIAVAVMFAATPWLIERKYVRYFALALLMSTIHFTAIVMIPVSFIVQGKPWNIKTLLLTCVALIAMNFSDALTGVITEFMAETQYSGEVNQFLETEGTNILRVLVFCIPPVLALLFRRFINAANSAIMDISTNMSIISMGAYIISSVTSGMFIGRMPIYFSLYNYILLPWLIENVFEEKSKKIVYAGMIACYLVFYYYQMTVAWDFSAFM